VYSCHYPRTKKAVISLSALVGVADVKSRRISSMLASQGAGHAYVRKTSEPMLAYRVTDFPRSKRWERINSRVPPATYWILRRFRATGNPV
jgi:hypothetical protein